MASSVPPHRDDARRMPPEILRLLARQGHCVTRSQLLRAGLAAHDIERLRRRRLLTKVHRGVYADHSGQLNWDQRAWVALLAYAPAALCGRSALRVVCGSDKRYGGSRIEVVISASRVVTSTQGIRIVRSRRFDDIARLQLSPPRVSTEEAALQVAARQPSEIDLVGELAAVLGAGRTTVPRLQAALAQRPLTPRRRLIESVLDDLEQGTCSVLEHGFLTKVERPHGLPTAQRQARSQTQAGTVYRDALYVASDLPGGALAVELDGRLFHDDAAQRDADLQRDLLAATDGVATVRLGWGQVFGRSCETAVHLGRLMGLKGWPGTVRPCGPGCLAGLTAV